MLVLIPAGKFLMGVEADAEENPVHEVSMDSFYIDKYEVTNEQYHAFCQARSHELPELWGMDEFRCGPDFPDHPVVGVSWQDAKDYAEWCGKRLPTEAEWEVAARGGLVGRDYPNGKPLDPETANYAGADRRGTMAVGSFPANGFGLHDMSGNVVEWVGDFYEKNFYRNSPTKNPKGPERGKFRVIRGGGWHSGPYCSRVGFRNALPGNWIDFNVGFRCAKDKGS